MDAGRPAHAAPMSDLTRCFRSMCHGDIACLTAENCELTIDPASTYMRRTYSLEAMTASFSDTLNLIRLSLYQNASNLKGRLSGRSSVTHDTGVRTPNAMPCHHEG